MPATVTDIRTRRPLVAEQPRSFYRDPPDEGPGLLVAIMIASPFGLGLWWLIFLGIRWAL